MDSTPESRIIHLHIPKTAGTALRAAFERAGGSGFRSFSHFDEKKFFELDPAQYDLLSGHFGYKTAAQMGGRVVTVLRHPVDRFLSVYYFWRQLAKKGIENNRNTFLASKYSLSEFIKIRDEPSLIEALYNTTTLQIAHGSSLSMRRELRGTGKSDDDIYKLAASNLSQIAVVGIQERMSQFAAAIEKKFSVRLRVTKANVTEVRAASSDVDMSAIRAIHEWCFMDLELYQRACVLVSSQESDESNEVRVPLKIRRRPIV